VTRALQIAGTALALGSVPVAAQQLALRGTAVSVRETVAQAGTSGLRTGIAWGGEGAFGLGPATLAVRYVEGSIDSATGTRGVDYVEGQVLLLLRPLRWVAAGFGPHARSFVQAGGTQRWLMWELHGQGIAPLAGSLLEAYLEGWVVVGSTIDLVEPLDHGLGVEGGLRVALGRLRYRTERLALGGGAREETHEQVALAIGIGRR
jgi:hypothetical protein